MAILRVMTFNVFSKDPADFPDDVDPHELDDGWNLRSGLNVACVKRYRPDLIGLQEMNREKYETYRRELLEYACDVPEDDSTAVPTIFWRAETLELIERGVEDPPGFAWVRLRLRENGKVLLHMNIQFEDGPEGEQSRLEGSRLMAERGAVLQRQGNGCVPLIVTGDFNCNPWSEPYVVFQDAGFIDTYRAAGHGDSATSSTFHGFRGEDYFAPDWGDELFWRVDWILTRDGDETLRTTSCTIVRHSLPSLYPSDHYPVVAELLLKGARPT